MSVCQNSLLRTVRHTLTFNDEEENDASANQVASSEDVAVAEVDSTGDEGCEEGDQEIPEPVGSS